MGKRLEIKLGDSFEDFFVRGIAKNPPVNSSVQFEILIPLVNEKKA
jgi:putative ABC transport system permease protein